VGTGVEQKAVDAPEEVVDDCDVGCMQETFNTRNKSHSSIITGFFVALEVMVLQLQLWHVVVNKLYKDYQKQLCGALWRGTCLLEVQEALCVFFQWILIGGSVCKEEEGTDSFQVIQYMIYVN